MEVGGGGGEVVVVSRNGSRCGLGKAIPDTASQDNRRTVARSSVLYDLQCTPPVTTPQHVDETTLNLSRNRSTIKQLASIHPLVSAAVVQGRKHTSVARTRSELAV